MVLQRFGALVPSTLFMLLSFLGALIGYWSILKHTSLFTAAFSGHVDAQSPLSGSREALDPKLTNTIAEDLIKLYYNGTGPVPEYEEKSPVPEPITPLSEQGAEASIVQEIVSIIETSYYPDQCSQCLAVSQVLQVAAISQPVSVFTNVLIQACHALPEARATLRSASCESHFSGVAGYGPYLAQLFSRMSLAAGDMHHLCSVHFNYCEEQRPVLIDEGLYFAPKPESASVAPEPSGEIINVLHLSDWHLDPRYDIGSEGNCSNYLCCRPYSVNEELSTDSRHPSIPASRFGSFLCDAPADLALSAFADMPTLFDMNELAFSIFTGDIVSHDPDDLISRSYVSYEEEITFKVFKRMLGDRIPVYAALGNHDTLPVGFNTPHTMNPNPANTSSNIFQWNYDLVSSLWSGHAWLNDTEAEFARTHYGAYATTTSHGLRIISLNSDFWYKENIFNFFNVTNPDPSGILKWLADELTACERRGQRAWIIAHVLSGYDGTAPMPNPTALFYSIIRRFSPATIAAVFFG
jgi:sphingomyelin phosphodiesterase